MKYTLWVIAFVVPTACHSHKASLSNYKQEGVREMERVSLQEQESLTQRSVEEEAVVKGEVQVDWDSFVIRYDTSLPADSLFGLPPIKEIERQRKRTERKQTETFLNKEYAEEMETGAVALTVEERGRQRHQGLVKEESVGFPLYIRLLAIVAGVFGIILFFSRK